MLLSRAGAHLLYRAADRLQLQQLLVECGCVKVLVGLTRLPDTSKVALHTAGAPTL